MVRLIRAAALRHLRTMSVYTAPLNVAFEIQRTGIKQSQQMIQQSVAFQQNAARLALSGLKAQDAMQHQGIEVTRAAAHSYLDAVDATTPDDRSHVDQLRQSVDEQFAQFRDNHARIAADVERHSEEGVDAYDEIVEASLDTFAEQIATLLEAHEGLENQTTDTFDDLEVQTDKFQQAFQERMDEQLENIERFHATSQEQFDEQFQQIEKVQAQLTEQVEQLQDQLPRGSAEADGQLENIEGLGSTYADRLREAGIETPTELTTTSVETVAETAEVPASQAQNWVDYATS